MDSLTALGAAALLSRVGFALYIAGLLRAKNSAGAVLRLISDLSISTLAFWIIGVAVLFQTHNQFFWIDRDYLFGVPNQRFIVSLFFFYIMTLTASGVVSGAVAERFKFLPLCAASLLLAGLIFPVAGHWVWVDGWLWRRGFTDFGGAAVLHMSAAACALAGAIVVGPRGGKFNRDGSSTMIPGHSVPFTSIGALIILVGFVPYVAGAGIARPTLIDPAIMASRAGLNVLLCGAASAMGGMMLSHLRYRKVDIGFVLIGFLGGLVASAAAAGLSSTLAAVATGLVAGFIVPLAAIALDLQLRVDDPAGVIAIHGVGGAWGTLAVAIFADGRLASAMHGRVQFIFIQSVGVVAIAALSAILSFALFITLKKTVGVRTREADEFDGLDLAEHDIGAYPDFQQNTIKSYHLREA